MARNPNDLDVIFTLEMKRNFEFVKIEVRSENRLHGK